MRRAVPFLAAGLLASACSTVDGPGQGEFSAEVRPQDETTTADDASTVGETDTSSPGRSESDADSADPDQTEPDGLAAVVREEPGRARALITPTGVVVPVVRLDDDGYVVLSPCGVERSLRWGTPITEAEVALDPGHGGEEVGAQGPNGLTEKDLNLQLAKRAATELRSRGISVVLTRTTDYRIPLSSRAAIANTLETELMVSIHHNAPVVNPSPGPGTEVFVQSDSAESRRLGGLVFEEVVAALSQFEDVEWVTASDAGALSVINNDGEDSYGMIRRPEMPAVLAEFGYLANASEAELFATEQYIDVAAFALAEAVERWLDSDAPGSGFVDEPRRFTPNGGTGGTGGCEDPPLE